MKTRDVAQLYSQYILPVYKQVPVCLVKGKGSKVWDIEGKEYIDFFPGWAVSGIGHCHPNVVNALKTQAKKILHVSNNFYNLKQGQLACEISKASFPARIFFSNSGAEAIEAAIKFARKFGRDSGRYEIITMNQSFHGRTYGAMSATGQERIRKGFEPVVPGFLHAEFNDLKSVEGLVTDKTVAILLEPVQGEGGINVADPDFMKGLRELCDRRKLLLILDEIQTGMGRTGRMFAYQHYGIEPDLMILAKSLGGGVPIGALVVHKKFQAEVFEPGSHGSTYGGNPLVTAAGLAVFKTLRKERLVQQANESGQFLGQRLQGLKEGFSFIEKVKGIAMMRALELRVPGAPIVDLARQKGLLINCTQETVLRIMPAINISRSLLRQGLRLLEEALKEYGQGQASP